jgi:hypothetical protein
MRHRAAAGVRVAALKRREQLRQRDLAVAHAARFGFTSYCLIEPPMVTTSATPGT